VILLNNLGTLSYIFLETMETMETQARNCYFYWKQNLKSGNRAELMETVETEWKQILALKLYICFQFVSSNFKAN